MSRTVVALMSCAALMSVAARLGMWLVVIGAGSVVVVSLMFRWENRRWRPAALALWSVTGHGAECGRAGQLAVLSFGDRHALSAATTMVDRVGVERLRAAGRMLDMVEVPNRRPHRRSVVVGWWVMAVLGLVGSVAVGFGLWLLVTVVTSTGAIVGWCRWRVATQVRPAQLARVAALPADASVAPPPGLAARELLAGSSRPDTILAETSLLLEHADLPLAERYRAWGFLEGLRLGKERGGVGVVAAGSIAAIFGVVAPWVVW